MRSVADGSTEMALDDDMTNPRGFPGHTMGNFAFFSALSRRFRRADSSKSDLLSNARPVGARVLRRHCANESDEMRARSVRKLVDEIRIRGVEFCRPLRTRLGSPSLQTFRPLGPPSNDARQRRHLSVALAGVAPMVVNPGEQGV